MKISFKNLLSSDQININDISIITNLANDYNIKIDNCNRNIEDLKGYILATLFFEPSTRTRFSFESAMIRLGGNVITLDNDQSSSVKKGETLLDTGRIVSHYADIAVIRHKEIESTKELSINSSIPIINAGNGTDEHPTQSLTDIYTILKEKGRLDNLNIGIIGDLRYGRTVYSLIKLLSLYKNNKFTLISHPLSKLETVKKEKLDKIGCTIIETEDFENNIGDLDILYVTRVQKERFENIDAYQKVKNKYHINLQSLKNAKDDLIIMHPLPRIDEIAIEVDNIKNAKYFNQARNGLFVRMALLKHLTKTSL